MTDIVEWLRASCARTTVIDITRLDEAADKITRLRAALENIAQYTLKDGCQCSACQHARCARAALGGGDEP